MDERGVCAPEARGGGGVIYTVMTLFVLGALFVGVAGLAIGLTWPHTFEDTPGRRK